MAEVVPFSFVKVGVPMTRKPDGWVQEDYEHEIESGDFVCVHKSSIGYACKPICLVPPALLDDIETFLGAIPNNRGETAWVENVAKHLLNKLREVRG